MRERQPLADADIRPALRARLLAAHGCQPDSILLEELGICRGQVRIDIAVVNGSVHGYEIKSDRDSLRRLAGQVELYSRVLDSATLVVGDRHLAEALKFLPKWWGVLRVEETSGPPRFRAVRRAANNPHRDSRSLVELLWLDDALVLLEAADAARGVRGKPRCVVWDRVCEKLSIDEIALAVRSRLKARATQKSPQQRP